MSEKRDESEGSIDGGGGTDQKQVREIKDLIKSLRKIQEETGLSLEGKIDGRGKSITEQVSVLREEIGQDTERRNVQVSFIGCKTTLNRGITQC